jgi:hypothetical protein
MVCVITVILWAGGGSGITGIRAGGTGYLWTLQVGAGEFSFLIKRDRDCICSPIEVFHRGGLVHVSGMPHAVATDGEWSVLGVSYRSEHEPLYWVVPAVFTRTSSVSVSYWLVFLLILAGHLLLFPRRKRVRAGCLCGLWV